MLEVRIITDGKTISPFDLPAELGKLEAARGIAGAIEGLIAFLDDLGGDPDSEDTGNDEDDGTGEDISWPEWQSRGRLKTTAGGYEMATQSVVGLPMSDDDEDDYADTGIEDDPLGCDPEEDCEHDGREA